MLLSRSATMSPDSFANAYEPWLPPAQVFLIFDTDKEYQDMIKVETQEDSFGDMVVYWTDIMHLHENAIYLKDNKGMVATFVKDDDTSETANSVPTASLESTVAYHHQTTTTTTAATSKSADSQPRDPPADASADVPLATPPTDALTKVAAEASATIPPAIPPNDHPTDAPINVPANLPVDAPTTSPPIDAPTHAPTEAPTEARAGDLADTQKDCRKDSGEESQTGICHPCATVDALATSPPSNSSATVSERCSTTTLVKSVSTLTIAARPSAELSLAEPNQRFQSAVIHKLDGLHDQGAKTQQLAQEIWKLQKQMNDRLILIQSKTEAILNQQLELEEYPIPRLFIVLPEEVTKYDPGNWFRTKFRLHFICEYGKHTEPSNSKVPYHLHLAKHEGYLIREPTEFFKKYGPFLLLMLELIKFGTSVAGHVVPTLASLKVVELLDSVQQTVESVTAKIDYSLECIDGQLAKVQASSQGDFADTESGAAITQQDLANYLNDVEGLEGVELRQLGSFLRTSEEENLLGNLYRMTTSDGHVKWVCRDHYRTGYQEKHVQNLRNIVKVAHGVFDEQLGKITIALRSSIAAAEFYNAISKAKGVLELIVDLSWECTRSDLEGLENALEQSRVSILRLHLRQYRTSLGSKLISTSTQYGVFFRIGGLPTMKRIHIVLSKELLKFSSFQPKTPCRLCKLSFELVAVSIGEMELEKLAEALKTNMTLTTLDLERNSIGDNGAQALSEALKTNSTLATLDLRDNSIGPNGAQALSEALKTNSSLTILSLGLNLIGSNGAQALSEALKTNLTLTTLTLGDNLIGSNGAQALSEALKTNSTLTTLTLGRNSIGDNGAQALSEALKTNSTLTTLTLDVNSIGPNGAQALSEALKVNSSLTTLTLGSNLIGDNGAQALSEALKTNSTLTTLDLRRNSIRSNGAQALSEALKTNPTLMTTLNLDVNSIGDNGAQALAEALKINSTVTIRGYCNRSSSRVVRDQNKDNAKP
ncbi:hypothetical protein BGZ72_000747 [Mortierella alpina]|nr:hypothetical protein BGZ72_000747 [Mortierella alpina]